MMLKMPELLSKGIFTKFVTDIKTYPWFYGRMWKGEVRRDQSWNILRVPMKVKIRRVWCFFGATAMKKWKRRTKSQEEGSVFFLSFFSDWRRHIAPIQIPVKPPAGIAGLLLKYLLPVIQHSNLGLNRAISGGHPLESVLKAAKQLVKNKAKTSISAAT